MALSPRVKKLLSFSVKFILLPLVALSLLYFAFSDLDLRSIWQAIKGADYFYVGLSFVTGYAAFVLIGLRWLIPLEALGYRHVSKIDSINAVTVTYITNLVIPRAGEIARCTALNQAEGLPVSKLLGTVIMERAIDVIMLVLSILLTILLQYDNIEHFFYQLLTARSGAAVAAPPAVDYKYILLGIVAVGCLIVYLLRKKLRHTAAYLKIAEFLSGIFVGIKSITRLPHKWMFILYTLLIWLMYYLMIFFMSYAFRETSAFSAANILYLMTVGGLAQLVPVQGGIGAYHSAMKIGIPILGIAAITPNMAMAFATLNHATQTIMQILTGAIALALISRAKVRRMSRND